MPYNGVMSQRRRKLPVPPAGILCDLDNTLIDTTWRDYHSFVDAARQFGISVRPYEQFRKRRLAGWSSREIAREWNPNWEAAEQQEDFLRVRHGYLDRAELMHSDRLFDGVIVALERLYAAGIPLATATLRSANGQTRREMD